MSEIAVFDFHIQVERCKEYQYEAKGCYERPKQLIMKTRDLMLED